MCVIIDTNMIGIDINSKQTNEKEKLEKYEAMKLLRRYIKKRKIKLILPPKDTYLSDEYKKIEKINEFLNEYKSQEFIKTISIEKFKDAERKLEREQKNYNIKYKSNKEDFSILALARASKTKLLVTYDYDLEKDFKSPDIIGGSIYKRKTQTNLLYNNKCP